MRGRIQHAPDGAGGRGGGRDDDGNVVSTNDTSEFSACALASCSGLAVFPHTVLAPSKGQLSWAAAADVRWVKGTLAQVASYTTYANGTLSGGSGLDISADAPAAGTGLYYLMRPLFCGSWQTAIGRQPGRDTSLP